MGERITNRQIYEMVLEIRKDVSQNTTDIAVLKNSVSHHSINWDRVLNIVIAILQALIIAKLLS